MRFHQYKLKTNRVLWAVLASAMFFTVWFLPTGIHKSPYLGSGWYALFTGDFFISVPEMLSYLAIPTVLFGTCAVVLGWVLQAIIVALCAASRGRSAKAT